MTQISTYLIRSNARKIIGSKKRIMQNGLRTIRPTKFYVLILLNRIVRFPSNKSVLWLSFFYLLSVLESSYSIFRFKQGSSDKIALHIILSYGFKAFYYWAHESLFELPKQKVCWPSDGF